jgi:uncharacterized protein (TIGR03000 family)
MVRRLGLVAVLAMAACLIAADVASACHKGCRGGRRHHRGGGCGGGGCAAVSVCGGGGCGGCAVAWDGAAGGPAYAWADEAPTNYARVILTLPEGATLTVNGQDVEAVAGTQTFMTPDLEPGQDYYYTIRANVVRDGQTVAVNRQVAVRAGQQSEVNLDPAVVSEE